MFNSVNAVGHWFHSPSIVSGANFVDYIVDKNVDKTITMEKEKLHRDNEQFNRTHCSNSVCLTKDYNKMNMPRYVYFHFIKENS